MDFGDILEKWDASQKVKSTKKTAQVSNKKANASFKKENSSSLMEESFSENPMNIWLSKYGTVDKDREKEEIEKENKFLNVEYLKSMKPDATLDLHGFTQDEAWSKLKVFVDSCYQKHLKKILIIHGKGLHSHGTDPVLGDLVRLFIERDKRLGLSGHPDRSHGGTGATWVIIKN